MDSKNRKVQMEEDRKKFLAALPEMIDLIANDTCAEIKDAMEHLRKVRLGFKNFYFVIKFDSTVAVFESYIY